MRFFTFIEPRGTPGLALSGREPRKVDVQITNIGGVVKMSKNFDNKKVVVAEIQEKLQRAKSVVLVDYMGINVEEATRLRASLRAAGIDYKVYKNNLFKRATEGTQYEEVAKDLVGPNAFAFSYEDATGSAKILKDFAKTAEKFELKSGVVEGVYYDAKGIELIADIPSREVLIAKLLGSLKSPISNLAYLLKAIADKQGESGAEEAKVEAPVEEVKAEEAPAEAAEAQTEEQA